MSIINSGKNTEINTVIVGIGGRMGQNNYNLLDGHISKENPNKISVVGGLEAPNSPLLNQKINKGNERFSSFEVKSELSEIEDFDVVVDFSGVKPTLHHLATAAKLLENNKVSSETSSETSSGDKKLGFVIGTTGFDEAQLAQIKQYSEKFPILLSGNFSTGINLLLRLIELGVRSLGKQYDAEIVEHHHREKVDSPSGTAMMIANSLLKEKGLTSDAIVYERNGIIGRRDTDTVGMSVLRGGGVIGQHEVHFLGDDEKLLISHEAFNRNAFTNGVAKGVYFIADQVNKERTGFFDMQNVLGFR